MGWKRKDARSTFSRSLVEKGYGYAYASARVGEFVKIKFERTLMQFTYEGNCLFYTLHDVHDHGMAWLGHVIRHIRTVGAVHCVIFN